MNMLSFNYGHKFLALLTVFSLTAILLLVGSGTLKAQWLPPPLIISDLEVVNITGNSATVIWKTNRASDSRVNYGIAPDVNIDGPYEPAWVTSHSLDLTDLQANTEYAYCAISTRWGSSDEECSTFTTLPEEEPEPTTGGGFRPTRAIVSGFAYPKAFVNISLYKIPNGSVLEKDIRARDNGSYFTIFENVPPGNYFVSVVAVDQDGVSSVRKTFTFSFNAFGTIFTIDDIYIPPTVSTASDVVSWGSELLIAGSAAPKKDLVIEIDEQDFETRSDSHGNYQIIVDSSQFEPGSVSVRVREDQSRRRDYDYSSSLTVVLSRTSVPEADMNKDGRVNIKDLSMFLANPKDMNKDGKINAADVSIFLKAFVI